jgi:hypothetical protein
MLFSAYYSGTNPVEFKHLGFPNYFRIELTAAKIIGAFMLLIPQVPARIKEWIYVAFSINLISAFIAKLNSGYSIAASSEPLLVFIILIVSIRYLDKLNKAQRTKDGKTDIERVS